MLVFEYLPNGSMCNHLYGMIHLVKIVLNYHLTVVSARHLTVVPWLADTGLDTTTKLEFKRRLSIALGAAKGRCKRK